MLSVLSSRRLAAFALLTLTLGPLDAAAQTPGCDIGSDAVDLDESNVQARLYNTGGLFWRGSGATYEVPKGSGLTPLFTMGLWVGAEVDGELRFAGSSYGPWEYWPGPLDAQAQTTAQTCEEFDRFWSVRARDVEDYTHGTPEGTTRGDGTTVSYTDLQNWPIAFGAPFFVDADGDGSIGPTESIQSLELGDEGYGTRQIDLRAGERPALFGLQTVWWVMNDAGDDHEWSGSLPLGIEVRVTAWVPKIRLGSDPDATGVDPRLNESTFYRYEVINRSDDVFEGTQAGLFVDADLGNYNDDYILSDSTRSMLGFYNGDNFDQGAYGPFPPAIGVDLLSGADGAMHAVDTFDSETGTPARAEDAYGYLTGFWNDGTPLRIGNDGYHTTGLRTRWAYSGRPSWYWSEYNIDGQGTANPPSDRRGVISVELGRMEPGERQTIDIGILWASENGATVQPQIQSLRKMLEVSDAAQAAYEDGSLFGLASRPTAAELPTAETPGLGLITRPNPAVGTTRVGFRLAEASAVRLRVLDVLGREVAVLAEGDRAAGEHRATLDTAALAPGVYVVVLETDRQRAAQTITVAR